MRIKAKINVVAIGGSTGGPVVLQTILSGLPKVFPVPVLIVQHIAAGFVQGLVEWLRTVSMFFPGMSMLPRMDFTWG
jgi:two-component system chemotaxis response regulator CheB